MTQLNSDVMRLMLPYFDAQTWAKLAQVCTTWKKIAYRPSVWMTLEWKAKNAHQSLFLTRNEIPSNARHIGEPSKLCFQAWAQGTHQLPREIVREVDPAKKLAAMYKLWSKHKTCVHVNHHVWTDVFRGRAYLQDLTNSDTCRLYLRLMDPLVNDANPYRSYLLHRVAECTALHDPLPNPVLPTTDLLGSIRVGIQQSHAAFRVALAEYRDLALANYLISIAGLSRHGSVEFSSNERQYNQRGYEMLDDVAFSA